MPGISSTIEIARKAIFASQMGLQVTGHNIANVNTEGYSRQSVILEESQPQSFSPGQIGTGVFATAILRSVDGLIENQLIVETGSYSTLDYSANVVGQVESLFDETSGANLGGRIDEFFNAWDDLSGNPQGLAERQAVESSAESLASAFRRVDSQLRSFQETANKDVASLVGEINQIAGQIAVLNGKIKLAVVGGQNPNDLVDQRAVLLQNLSEKIGFSTLTDEVGQVNVVVANGKLLVNGETAGTLSAVPVLDPGTGETWNSVRIMVPGQVYGASEDITASIASGRVKAAVEFRDRYVPYVRSKLDNLAYSIADSVNQRHAVGYGLDGTTGTAFFTPPASVSGAALNFAVNPAVAADLNLIAAALEDPTDPAGSGKGDNRNAVVLAGLRNVKYPALGDATFTEYLAGMVGEVGSEARGISEDLMQQKNILDYVTTQRERVSGVSLDEEMTNLLKFQRAFEAATKLITISDELMKQVIELR
jgi:flagellar hook-associated protein 1 FlgK